MRFGPLAIRIVLCSLCMLCAAFPATAQSALDALVPVDARQALASGEPIVRPLQAGGSLSLVPAVASGPGLVEEVRAARLTVGAEVLVLLRGMAGELDTPEGWLRVYNSLHAVSTLKGITYWSASRKQDRVLFTESFAIPSPRELTRVADPVFSEIPAEDILHTFQQDQSYGKNTYTHRFSRAEGHLVVRISNTSTVTVAFIPLMQPGGFVSCCILVPSGRDLLFYGVSYIRTSMPIGDRQARQQSLANRLIAMANWVRTHLA